MKELPKAAMPPGFRTHGDSYFALDDEEIKVLKMLTAAFSVDLIVKVEYNDGYEARPRDALIQMCEQLYDAFHRNNSDLPDWRKYFQEIPVDSAEAV